jgi:hypothetical protein
MYQNAHEEMFFEEQKMIFGFCLNQLVDGGVHKLFRVEGEDLTWGNVKWLDEVDMVQRC